MVFKNCEKCGKKFGYYPSRKVARFCSLICSNNLTPESVKIFKTKLGDAHRGMKRSPTTCKNISNSRLGNKNPNWHGGVSTDNERIRRSIEFRLWREAVFARDGWICQKCKERSDELHPHHIRNFAEVIELRFAIDNGITFCKDCHKEFHKIYGNKNNNIEQLLTYLK